MRKIYLSLFVVVAFCVNGYSQAVEQGNSIVDLTYGWPNLWTNVFKTAVTDATSTNIKTGTIGPVAIKYEYMVADKIGVGLVVNYANSSVQYDEQVGSNNYNYKLSVPRIRVMGKFGFHYGNSDMFDGYTNICVGYGGYSFKYTTNDPDYTDDAFTMSIAPVAFRVATGGRVFFTDNLGAMLEFGVGGGGLVEFGLTAKF